MATKQEVIEFVKKLYPESLHNWNTDRDNSLHPITDVAQAGLETGWQIKGIDNNIFGITKGSSWTGPTKLVTTTEYFDTDNKKFNSPEEILSVQYRPDKEDYKYTVKRLFRVYDSISDCMKDHNSLLQAGKYASVWHLRDNPKAYITAIAPIYATAKNYASVMYNCIDMVDKIVKEQKL